MTDQPSRGNPATGLSTGKVVGNHHDISLHSPSGRRAGYSRLVQRGGSTCSKACAFRAPTFLGVLDRFYVYLGVCTNTRAPDLLALFPGPVLGCRPMALMQGRNDSPGRLPNLPSHAIPRLPTVVWLPLTVKLQLLSVTSQSLSVAVQLPLITFQPLSIMLQPPCGAVRAHACEGCSPCRTMPAVFGANQHFAPFRGSCLWHYWDA